MVLGLFVGGAVLARRWVQHTGPMAGFDEMGIAPSVGSAPANKDCTVPAFAKAMGHEEMWKKHNGC